MKSIQNWKLACGKVFVALAAVSAVWTLPVAHAEQAEQKSAMQSYVEAMHPGWNLGNTFEASGAETSWGNPATTEPLIEKIAEQGYKSIRIPITWNHRLTNGEDYLIQEAFLDRIEEVVGWSLDAGLYVMINLHHDSLWLHDMEQNYDADMDKYRKIWTQIADRFKSYPHTLSFEAINEPRFSDDWNEDAPAYFRMVEDLSIAFHGIVRDSGGNNGTRPLIFTTLTGSGAQARVDELDRTMAKLDDDNMIATIHYYGFYPFSVNLGGSTSFDAAALNDVVQTFDYAHQTFTAKGIPVIVGEFGLLGFDRSVETIQQGEKLKYFEYVMQYAKEKGFATMLWDNGQHFNRRTLEWRDPDLYAVMNASLTGRSSYGERDSVFVKKGEEDGDVSLPLLLNGNELVGLELDGRPLAAGTDYEATADSITFKSALLQPLMTGDYGLKGVVRATFTAGADWKFHLYYYDTPTMKSVDTYSSAYMILTSFNGDKLATMEATTLDGQPVGPQSWTPFKEYGGSFMPDAEKGTITLTQDFFNELADGEYKLKFHFWSGSQVEYAIIKSGTQISGKAAAESGEDAAPSEPGAGEAEPEPTGAETEAASPDEAASQTEKDGGGLLSVLIIGMVGLLVVAAAGLYAVRRFRSKQRTP